MAEKLTVWFNGDSYEPEYLLVGSFSSSVSISKEEAEGHGVTAEIPREQWYAYLNAARAFRVARKNLREAFGDQDAIQKVIDRQYREMVRETLAEVDCLRDKLADELSAMGEC